MIRALPDPETVTVKDEAAIKAAREAYDRLSEKQQADPRLTPAIKKKLADCEERLAAAKKDDEDQAAATKVSDMIKAIPDDPSKATGDQVAGAVAAYNSLTPEQKKLITASELKKLQKALDYPASVQKTGMKSVKAKK